MGVRLFKRKASDRELICMPRMPVLPSCCGVGGGVPWESTGAVLSSGPLELDFVVFSL